MIRTLARITALSMTFAFAGCSHMRGVLPDPVKVQYQPGDAMPELATVHRTGDFAIFYGDDRKPQMPVRVHAGEKIGFIMGSEGAIKAVAGDFKMNVSSDVSRAYWKRMNYLDD